MEPELYIYVYIHWCKSGEIDIFQVSLQSVDVVVQRILRLCLGEGPVDGSDAEALQDIFISFWAEWLVLSRSNGIAAIS